MTEPIPRLSEKVFDWLTDQIVLGKLRPGQWISENDLTERLGVSRAPVREALRDLARERIVEVRPRRGTVLPDFSPKDIDDLYRACEHVDPEVDALIAETVTEPGLARIRETVALLQDTITAPADQYHRSVRRHSELLWELCPNQVLSDLSASLWRRSIPYRGVVLAVPDLRQRVADHATTLLALAEQRDSDGAREASREMIVWIRHVLPQQVFIQIGDGHLQRTLAVS